MNEGYDTPEEAAVADWPPRARARAVEMTRHRDAAVVLVDTIPSHPMEVRVERVSGRWHFVGDVSA